MFRVYGDANMMRAAEGAEETALTSYLSREAINALVENKAQELSGRGGRRGQAAAPRPVPSVEEIFRHFPDRVRHEGQEVSLETWATGAPMKEIIHDLLTAFSGTYSAVTGVVSVASTVKTVSAGLEAKHSPADPF